MQIAILSGGLATRLKDLAKDTPKAMLPVEGKPFLQHQLELLKKNGIKDIVVCAGHLSERIVEYFGDGGRFGVNIKYSVESNGLLGTAGALKNAERLLEDKFFVMYGDSYLRLDYGEIESYFGTVKEPVLMVVYKNGNRLDRSNVLLSGGFVAKYDKNAPEGLEYIDYGLSIFRKDAISGLPAGRAVSLEEVFARLAREGSIRAYIAKESFFEIGSIEGLERFRKYIKGL